MSGIIFKSFRNKKGEVLVLSMLVITIALLLTVLLVDFGLAFATKAQVQSIADAMALGGASYGNEAYKTLSAGKKVVIVDDKLAVPKAQQILNANKKFLPNRAEIITTELNPSGKKIDGKSMNWRDQYYSGNFTVRLTSRYKTMFLGGDKKKSLLGASIPEIRLQSESRVKVTPK